MLIAQITDIHLGFDPDDPAEFNRRRLDQVLQLVDNYDQELLALNGWDDYHLGTVAPWAALITPAPHR